MNNERDYLRRQAGLSMKINEDTSRIRTMDVEARLLQSFSDFVNQLRYIKEQMKGGPENTPGSFRYGSQVNREVFRDEKNDVDKERLQKVAMKKLEIVKNIIDECFGKEEKEEPKEDEDY